MTDRAAAARPGWAGLRCCRPGIHGDAGLSPAGTGIAACRQRAPGLSRCTRAAIAACPPLVKAPRAHRLWVSLIDGPGSESRLDIVAVNVRLIYALLRRGVWTIPFFLHAQGVDCALPGESPFMGAARPPDPQHFPKVRTGPAPFYTSDPHGCAQQSGKRFPCPAGRQRVSVPVWREAAGTRDARGSGLGPDDIAREGGHWMLAARPAGQAARVPSRLPAGHAHRDPAGCASSICSSCPGSVAADAGPPTCATTTTSRVRRGPRR